ASELVEVNIAYARRVWRLFGALHGFLKLFFQQVGLVLLRFHRLPEQRLLAALLLLHGAGSFIKVVEGLHPRRRGVGDDGVRGGINLQHRPTARTAYLEVGRPFSHCRNNTPFGFKDSISSGLVETSRIPRSG